MSVAPTATAPWPDTISTRATIGSGNVTPTNENPPGEGGAAYRPRFLPWASNSRIEAEPGRSTSENTTPNPVDVAAVRDPGTKNSTVIALLPTAANVRVGLKNLNSLPNSGFRSAKLLSLTRNPVPGVENTAPRARPVRTWLKKSAGKSSVLVVSAGTA